VVVVAAPVSVDARRFAALQGRCLYLPKPIVIDTLIEAFERRSETLVRQYCIFHNFSEQEAATFDGAVEGLGDDAIAEAIGCKATTVRTYWSRIGEKTNTAGKDQTLAHFARWLLPRATGAGGPKRATTPPPDSRRNVVQMTRRR
jgi:DNA-binding NarL/FixJ family response regulator